MAIAITAVGNATGVTNGTHGACTTGSFTPADGSLLVAIAPGWIANARTSGSTIASSPSLTWTQRVYREVFPGGGGSYPTLVAIYTAPVSTGVSMTVTFDPGTMSGSDANGRQYLRVFQVTGHNVSSPVAQTFDDGNEAAYNYSYYAPLSSAPAATSIVLEVASMADAAPQVSGQSLVGISVGYSLLSEDVLGGSVYNYALIGMRTGETSTDVIFDNIKAQFNHTIAAIEIAVVAATSTDENLMDKSGMTTMGGMMG